MLVRRWSKVGRCDYPLFQPGWLGKTVCRKIGRRHGDNHNGDRRKTKLRCVFLINKMNHLYVGLNDQGIVALIKSCSFGEVEIFHTCTPHPCVCACPPNFNFLFY